MAVSESEAQDVWRALGNPIRRQLLDLLSEGPRSTGELADAVPELSRFAVMQHLGVLTDAGLVLVRRRGRYRYNHLNPVPLRAWYQRWASPLADSTAAELLALGQHIERGSELMGDEFREEVRTVRIETEIRLVATPERVFKALTDESLEWFPHTYGEERVKGVVFEPRVGGLHYEDWGEDRGHLYGWVTAYDPPHHFATRGRLMPGVTLDNEYTLIADGEETVVRSTKVGVGPMTEAEARSIRTYGDLAAFEEALRTWVEQR